MQPAHEQYFPLEDGRRLCAECNDTRVKDTMECQPLYREILKFYKSMGMPIAQEVPMLLVERTALNSARELEKDVSSFISHVSLVSLILLLCFFLCEKVMLNNYLTSALQPIKCSTINTATFCSA